MSALSDLMYHSPDGVFAIDAEHRVLFWNPACEELTGIPAEQALGQPCHALLQGRDMHGQAYCKSNCALDQLVHGGPPPSCLSLHISHLDGRSFRLNVGTMLVPSAANPGTWNIVHIMRRSRESQVEDLFGCNGCHESGQVSEQMRDNDAVAVVSQLTNREREILRLLAKGNNVEPMAQQLHISPTTVRNHIQRLMAKLDVHSRAEAVAYAHRNKLI